MIDEDSWRPGASWQTLKQRADCLALIRRFFAERGVVEVQTPLLTPAGVTDPHIQSLQIAGKPGFLRTSPEYFHKRLLAAGCGDLYELGPVFRDGESGRHHRMEFLLLEWYRLDWHWRELAREVCDLINISAETFGRGPFRIDWLPWHEAFAALSLDIPGTDPGQLRSRMPELHGEHDPDAMLDYLFTRDIQQRFDAGVITVVHDYPASQAALARIDPDNAAVAQRFEVFLGPVELANGYQELACAAEQEQRFRDDNRRREQLGLTPMPVDTQLLLALAAGLPDCAGVALGVDRLLMSLLSQRSIDQVCAFD